jgi:hypothetical protein
MAERYKADFNSTTDIFDETAALLDGDVAHWLRVSERQEGFSVLTSLGARALQICQQARQAKEATYKAHLWTSNRFAVGDGVGLRVQVVTSHRRVVGDSANGPYFKEVLIPRRGYTVPSVIVSSDMSSFRYPLNVDLETRVRISDRKAVESSLPDLAKDWCTAAAYISQCLESVEAITRPELGQQPFVPEVLQQWYAQVGNK